MPKKKSETQLFVPDGSGVGRPVVDLRFEEGDWPVTLDVPATDAATWMAHLAAEAEERGWPLSSFSQLEPEENSGTLSIVTGSIGPVDTLEIVWEKERGGALRLKARASAPSALELLREVLNSTDVRQRAGTVRRTHQRALLTYDGLPWRGELWLDKDLRLGPPSKYPDALLGPQNVIVDAMVEGIGSQGVFANFQKLLYELRVFLAVAAGERCRQQKFEYGWVYELDAVGALSDCVLRPVGYVELSPQPDFPEPGDARPVERRPAPPRGKSYGITADMHERWVRSDIEELWRTLRRLPEDKREHFLRAGNAYLVAGTLWPEQRTAYASFLVVACEALKPKGRRHDTLNIYDVVASLVGEDAARVLKEHASPPQKVRSKHLHRGEVAAGEFLPMMMHDQFQDPSFDNMLRDLSILSRLCLIEWLRCEGTYEVTRMSARRPALSPRE